MAPTEPDQDPGSDLAAVFGFSTGQRTPAKDALAAAERAFVGRYAVPTQLQRSVGAVLLEGRSALVIAATAAGKTEAALIGLVARSILLPGLLLYIAPTRALINDISARIQPGFRALGRTVRVRHGDAASSDASISGAACLVTTPESLESAFERNAPWIDQVRFVVLDELHTYDRQPRGTQLRCLMSRLHGQIGVTPQLVALSATMADQNTAAAYWGIVDPLAIISEPEGPARRRQIVAKHGGTPSLKKWLRSMAAPAKAIVFANSRRRCDELYAELSGNSDHVVLVHYSNLESSLRRDTEDALRRLDRVLCVATSTLELGIDIGDMEASVLADPPWSSLALVQRVGRSGRRGAPSAGFAFPTTDRALLRLLAVATLSPEESDRDMVQPVFYSVAVQQALCLIAGSRLGRIRSSRLASVLTNVGLGPDGTALEILEHLRATGVFRYLTQLDAYELDHTQEDLLRGSDRWTNFPTDRARWTLRDRGKILARINMSSPPDAGDVILFAGRFWRVYRVDRATVHVSSSAAVANPLRATYDDVPPLVPASTAAAMRRIATAAMIDHGMKLDGGLTARVQHIREQVRDFDDANFIMDTERGPKLVTFAGTRANLMLMAYVRGVSADEVGVLLRDRRALSLPRTPDPITAAATAGWEALGKNLAASRWHALLPRPMRREEVVTQLVGDGVVEAIRSTLDRPVLDAGPLPLSL